MVTSGGYQRATARIIADSILNLQELKLISCDEAEQSHSSSSGNESLNFFLLSCCKGMPRDGTLSARCLYVMLDVLFISFHNYRGQMAFV